MPKTKPLTASEVAELLGVSAGRVSQLVAEGLLAQDAKGQYPREETYLALIAHLRKASDLAAVRKQILERRERILARAEEREDGRTLDVAKADAALSNRILATREKLLRLATVLAQRAPYWKSVQDGETEIARDIEACLEDLSRPGWIDEATQ